MELGLYKRGDKVLIDLVKSRLFLGYGFYKQLLLKNGVAEILSSYSSEWTEIIVDGLPYSNNIFTSYIIGKLNVNFKIVE